MILAPQEATFTADDKEHVFLLVPPLRIAGHVTDVVTGRPIDRFTIIPVRVLDETRNWFYVDRQEAKEFRGGNYSLPESDARYTSAYRVQVEADGYRSAMSGAFHIGDSNTVWNFRLQPLALRGRVLSGGRPVSGAKVFLATKTQPIDRWVGYKNAFSESYCRTKTDELGKFTFPAQFEPYKLIAIADGGYADTSRTADQQPGDLVLENGPASMAGCSKAASPSAAATCIWWPLRSPNPMIRRA